MKTGVPTIPRALKAASILFSSEIKVQARGGLYAAYAFMTLVFLLILLMWNAVAYRGAKQAFEKLASGVSFGASRSTKAAYLRSSRSVESVHSGGRVARGVPKILSFEAADLLLMVRDPINILLMAAPILIAIVLGRGVPWLAGAESPIAAAIPAGIGEAVPGLLNNIRSFALLLSPLMYGMIGAFLFLEEKDSGLLPFLRTVPAPRGWFLVRRCRQSFLPSGSSQRTRCRVSLLPKP